MNLKERELGLLISSRIDAELRLLPEPLRKWAEAHRTKPREITVSSDPETTQVVRVWLVTQDVGKNDASSNVVYDAARNEFGLVTALDNGVLWYQGAYGSFAEAVESI